MIYTKEEIQQMDIKTAQQCLTATEREYRVEESLIHNMGNWVLVDKITDQMLWLEDHIHTLTAQQAAQQRAIA